MDRVFIIATSEMARFLDPILRLQGQDWWKRNVIDRLSFQQQRMAEQKHLGKLTDLDLAALLRVTDQNWHEITKSKEMPREARGWIRELQSARNRWAHRSAEPIPADEHFRDADSLLRLLRAIEASPESLHAAEVEKQEALAKATRPIAIRRDEPQSQSTPFENNDVSTNSDNKFTIGDIVALKADVTALMPIVGVEQTTTETKYKVFRNNAIQTLYESQLVRPEKSKSAPVVYADRLKACLSSRQILFPSNEKLFSFRMGRVNFVPYQYRPVLRLIKSDRPRILIADEVGVGKTIEAGLIIKELQARMDVRSILIICPKALVAEKKWYMEMKRFDESFTALDGKTLRHCIKESHLDGEWPKQFEKCILPFSLFDSDLVLGKEGKKKSGDLGLIDLDPPPRFDLVIVDEAHHIRNSETFLHQGIRYFCDNAQAVVLMTATPVQLGSNDLFTLLNVLRPDLIIDQASFAQMAEPNAHINEAIRICRMAEPTWEDQAHKALGLVAETEWGRMFLRESPRFQKAYDDLSAGGVSHERRVAIIRDLEELYTFSSLINRTRRRDIGEFSTRKPETIRIDFTVDQRRLHDDLLSIIARILIRCHGQQNVKFMMTTIRRQAASCLYGLAPMLREILEGKLDQIETGESEDTQNEEPQDGSFINGIREDVKSLLRHAETLNPIDPKIDAFVKVIRDKLTMPKGKALVFSTFRHTLAYLSSALKAANVRHGVIHGSIHDQERSDLRARFALPKDDSQAIDVLLSSEVGCEGLDFQFCDMLVNYDLPWNPMRIEQRIGRIDRYGQTSETVVIVNMVTPETVDADIYDRCLSRIGVFQHAVGGSEEILGKISQEIHSIYDNFSLSQEERDQRLRQLSDNGIRIIREEQQLEENQASLFGLNVPGMGWREEIAQAESQWLSPQAIESCVLLYLNQRIRSESPIELSDRSVKSLKLDLTGKSLLLEDLEHLKAKPDDVTRRWEKWLKSTRPTISVTFKQEKATSDREVEFINILHPLVRQAANYLTHIADGGISLCAASPDVPAGIYPFSVYQWTFSGSKAEDRLQAIAMDDQVEACLLDLLWQANDDTIDGDASSKEQLERRHYEKWSTERSQHMQQNRELIEQRIQSLSVSHKARCQLLSDQIAKAGNDKIHRMRQGELNRANMDYDKRLKALERDINSGDIVATRLITGRIRIINSKGIA
jgi:ATP-dependent helicase HepA